MKCCLILFSVIIISCSTLYAQSNFYNLNTIQKIEVFFAAPNWDNQMDTAKAGFGSYIIADSVKINNTLFLNAGVKYKGASTYDAARIKNPLHISLDEIDATANYEGFSEIKLGNCYTDASMMREILAYEILSKYMHCSKANFAQVYINGAYIGLYNNAEHVGSNFVKKHFYTQDNTVIKANPADVNAAKPDLTYQGVDSTNYYNRYELKSKKAWKHLINLCDTLSNNFTAIEKEIDVDRALWMLAFNNVTVNLDSYTGSFKQNYYLVRDNNFRFNPVIWDLNMCFGGFALTGTSPTLSLAQKQNLTPTLHKNDVAWPLINKSLNNNRFYLQYLAHMRTINNENFKNGNYIATANVLKTLIDTAAINDVNKFYTNTEFQNALTTTSSTLPMSNGIQEIMDARGLFLAATAELSALPPVASATYLNPATPIFNTNTSAHIKLTNATTAYFGYRSAKDKPFTRLNLFDDGMHNDGLANDGEFAATFLPSGVTLQYYFYAENGTAGAFFPERAEHEFYETPVFINSIPANAVTLNECMSNNTTHITDANGEFEDWVELYNNTNNLVALGNAYLTDSSGNLLKWRFPTDAVIPANGFYTVWADDDLFQSGTHTNFKLSDTNNFIGFSLNNSVSFTDSITTPILFPNQTQGKIPNGIGKWFLLEPTFNTSNKFIVAIENLNPAIAVSIFPNPAADKIFVLSSYPLQNFQISNIHGQTIFFNKELIGNKNTIDLNGIPEGIYLINYYINAKPYIFKLTKTKK